MFPPDPTATNLGLLKVVTGVNPIPYPKDVKVVAPLPVQLIPSGDVAYVFPPEPVAVQKDPFQLIFCPVFAKTVKPNPNHAVPLNE